MVDVVDINRCLRHSVKWSNQLPTIFNQRAMAEAGGLTSYGPSFPGLFRRAAEFVDKILREAKPADIPVEQPTGGEQRGGTVRPSIRAAEALMTNSNLVACTTGRSAGLEPFSVPSFSSRAMTLRQLLTILVGTFNAAEIGAPCRAPRW